MFACEESEYISTRQHVTRLQGWVGKSMGPATSGAANRNHSDSEYSRHFCTTLSSSISSHLLSYSTIMPTSITSVLPSELLARVFSFLTERKDVAACRLVSRSFHELSSPFLITKAVFALRLDELTRLRELMRHPYFSRYVGTLIYVSTHHLHLSFHAQLCHDDQTGSTLPLFERPGRFDVKA